LLASLPVAGGVMARNPEAEALRAELERTYVSWLQATRRRDVAAFDRNTSRYRKMCLRNEVVSMRQPWPAAVFNSVLQAPDLGALTFIDATAAGDTARAVYFGRVDFALDSVITPENPLVIRFLREGVVLKFDRIQYVNLGSDEDTRREARAGGRKWLESEDFQLTGKYPQIPKPCLEPYQIAALSIVARSCKVTVDVNNGTHVETVSNNTGGRIITGGLRKGPNLIRIAPAAEVSAKVPPLLEISIVTRAETYRPPVKLWTWKPREPVGQWQPKYEASVFVKSRVVQ
jgi:hypothetical protein